MGCWRVSGTWARPDRPPALPQSTVDWVESEIEGYQRPIDCEILPQLLIGFDATIVDERACFNAADHPWRSYEGCTVEDSSHNAEHSW